MYKIPDYILVVRVPAKQTGWMSKAGYKFNDKGVAICSENNETYLFRKNVVKKY